MIEVSNGGGIAVEWIRKLDKDAGNPFWPIIPGYSARLPIICACCVLCTVRCIYIYIYTHIYVCVCVCVYNHPGCEIGAEWSDEMGNKTFRAPDVEPDVESTPLVEGSAKINSTCRVRSS